MAERNAELDLVFDVVEGVQRHVSGLREDVVAASHALEPLRDDAGLSSEVRERIRGATAELGTAVGRLGELQLILAAAAQWMVARNGARRRQTDDF